MGSPPVAGAVLPVMPLEASSARGDDDASDASAETTGFGSSKQIVVTAPREGANTWVFGAAPGNLEQLGLEPWIR
jgi:hypothetical protein